MTDAKTTFMVGDLVQWNIGTTSSEFLGEIKSSRPPGPFRITQVRELKPRRCDCSHAEMTPHDRWCASRDFTDAAHPQLVRMVSMAPGHEGQEYRPGRQPSQRVENAGWVTAHYLLRTSAAAPAPQPETPSEPIVVPLNGTAKRAAAAHKATQLSLFQM